MNMQPVNLAEEFSKIAFNSSARYVAAKAAGDENAANYIAKNIADLGMEVEGIVASEAHCARWDADHEWDD